jgi:hypothetical protein
MNENFKVWLREEYAYSQRVSGDICSRLKRASKLINLNSSNSDEVLLFNLSQKKDFLTWSTSVRSQVRKAVKLFREFNKL